MTLAGPVWKLEARLVFSKTPSTWVTKTRLFLGMYGHVFHGGMDARSLSRLHNTLRPMKELCHCRQHSFAPPPNVLVVFSKLREATTSTQNCPRHCPRRCPRRQQCSNETTVVGQSVQPSPKTVPTRACLIEMSVSPPNAEKAIRMSAASRPKPICPSRSVSDRNYRKITQRLGPALLSAAEMHWRPREKYHLRVHVEEPDTETLSAWTLLIPPQIFYSHPPPPYSKMIRYDPGWGFRGPTRADRDSLCRSLQRMRCDLSRGPPWRPQNTISHATVRIDLAWITKIMTVGFDVPTNIIHSVGE
jgi:hypothetical protein